MARSQAWLMFCCRLVGTHREPVIIRGSFLTFSRRRSGMATRGPALLISAAILASMGASYPTTNFVVEAPTPEIARQVGQWAEYYRKEKAIQWLGREMPNWQERCPLHVRITMNGAGGATSFNF